MFLKQNISFKCVISVKQEFNQTEAVMWIFVLEWCPQDALAEILNFHFALVVAS